MISNDPKFNDEWKAVMTAFQAKKQKATKAANKNKNYRAIHVTSSGVVFIE